MCVFNSEVIQADITAWGVVGNSIIVMLCHDRSWGGRMWHSRDLWGTRVLHDKVTENVCE